MTNPELFNSPPNMAPIIVGAVILVSLLAAAALFVYMMCYQNPADEALAAAGISEKTAPTGAVSFDYAERPDSGPALVLLHAQTLDWYTYNNVMPELSKKFHVFAVDYPGHGKTSVPADYPMTANQIGSDLADFLKSVVGSPAM
jgi:hypothetical protein